MQTTRAIELYLAHLPSELCGDGARSVFMLGGERRSWGLRSSTMLDSVAYVIASAFRQARLRRYAAGKACEAISPSANGDCFVARPVREAGARLANSAPRNDGLTLSR